MFPSLLVTDSENRESLSKNGITHILSVYNNAKPVFEVSGKSWLVFLDVLWLKIATFCGKSYLVFFFKVMRAMLMM